METTLTWTELGALFNRTSEAMVSELNRVESDQYLMDVSFFVRRNNNNHSIVDSWTDYEAYFA